MKSQLETRNKMKSKKPEFRRQNVNRYKSFEESWRRPTGIHSKLRRGFRGKWAMPAIGYSSPRSVKGLTHNGFVPVVVSNVKNLENLGKEHAIVISSNVGMKNRIKIIEAAKSKNLKVLGVKDFDKYLQESKKLFDERKNQKGLKKTERQKLKQESEKKSEEKKTKENQKANKTETKEEKPNSGVKNGSEK
ncbi:50S ribosomal protein L32e [Candidatus Woesearchaeota archaeon]|nr:50S ribosomal protein L32e [Candidatus Woesearchaeota archaeon]